MVIWRWVAAAWRWLSTEQPPFTLDDLGVDRRVFNIAALEVLESRSARYAGADCEAARVVPAAAAAAPDRAALKREREARAARMCGVPVDAAPRRRRAKVLGIRRIG